MKKRTRSKKSPKWQVGFHNREKEKPTKVVEVEQSKEHDPRMLSFSKKSYKRRIEGTHHSNDIKRKIKCQRR